MHLSVSIPSLAGRDRDYGPLKYRHPRQLFKLLLINFARWLLTAAIVGSLYAVLVDFSNKGAMLPREKHAFNALIIALSIMLSLNLDSSLKAMTGDLRWWVLSLRDWTLPEADLILQSEHFSHLLKLFVVARNLILRCAIVLWILTHIVRTSVPPPRGKENNMRRHKRIGWMTSSPSS
jgi:hypothetical protein